MSAYVGTRSAADDPPDAGGVDIPHCLACLACLAPTDPLAKWCPKCGVPVGQFATTDPILHIYSQGSAYRNAVSARIGWLGLGGMWALFGPGSFGLFSMAADVWHEWSLSTRFGAADALALPIILSIATALLAALYAALLYQVTRNFVRQRRYLRGVCGFCSYPLTGLPTPHCPECGRAVPPDIFEAAGEPRG